MENDKVIFQKASKLYSLAETYKETPKETPINETTYLSAIEEQMRALALEIADRLSEVKKW